MTICYCPYAVRYKPVFSPVSAAYYVACSNRFHCLASVFGSYDYEDFCALGHPENLEDVCVARNTIFYSFRCIIKLHD